MSKASEWVRAGSMHLAARPVYECEDLYRLRVSDSGMLDVKIGTATAFIKPTNALALAAWIIDTFGEPSKESTNAG